MRDSTQESLYVDLVRHVDAGTQLLALDRFHDAVRPVVGDMPDPSYISRFVRSMLDPDKSNGLVVKAGYSKTIDALCAHRDRILGEINAHFETFLAQYGILHALTWNVHGG